MAKMPIVTCIRSEGSKSNLRNGRNYLVVADVQSAVTKNSDAASGYVVREYDFGEPGDTLPAVFARSRFEPIAHIDDEDVDR